MAGEEPKRVSSLASPPSDVREIFERLLLEATDFDQEGELPGSDDAFVRFLPEYFFTLWFRHYGHPYLFLFKKNLQVTNLQLAELVALIQTLSCDQPSGLELDLQFISHKEFVVSLRELVDAFPIRTRKEAKERYRTLADLYTDLLRSTVVIDPYFGSCSVFLPRNLLLDLALVCGYSGYIHACGRSIHVRNANKSTAEAFFRALESYLNRYHRDSSPLFFAVYSHEDFQPGDQEINRQEKLLHGLDDKKIYVERFYMGSERLAKVLKDLETDPRFKERLKIPPPGDRRQTHRSESRESTIWLGKDFSIRPGWLSRGEDVYYLCYEQLYKNDNPFHIFDENKPAWITHTTTPQTLIGAMLNVTRPGWPAKPRICDPFAGTGSTAFEALKYQAAEIVLSDVSPLTELVCRDNLTIFGASADQIDRWCDFLNHVIEPSLLSPLLDLNDEDAFRFFLKVKSTFAGFISEEGEIRVDDEQRLAETLLREMDLRGRLLAYVALRAIRRNEGAQARGTFDWGQSFQLEATRMRNELGELAELRRTSLLRKEDRISVIQATYSGGCTTGPETFQEAWNQNVSLQRISVEDLEENSFDVIIADPPYGFNTEEDIEILARLYVSMIPTMVKALRDGGQLVLALPERSYSGRRSPYFTHKEIVTQQVLRAAHETNRQVVTRSVPEPTRLYRPPYYWRSEKALARTILHFRLRREERQQRKDLLD